MREIKYRIWSVDRERYVQDEDWYYLSDEGELWNIYSHYYAMAKDFCDPELHIIEQYTGLKDKNGKEIYEGDVISRENTYENNCMVKWDDESCGFTLNYIYFDESYNMNEFWDDFEVIGNIHENPELLKER